MALFRSTRARSSVFGILSVDVERGERDVALAQNM